MTPISRGKHVLGSISTHYGRFPPATVSATLARMGVARDARQEAYERLGARYEVRVLEPSPPATLPPGVVDDPVARGEVAPQRRLVSPVSTGDLLWEQLAGDDAELASWCAERWLARLRRLEQPPSRFAQTRDALQLVAEHVMSPTRARDQGLVTLRWTFGGFGTPFFGSDSQLRVEGDQLVVQHGDQATSTRIARLSGAANFIGFDLPAFEGLARDELTIDAESSRFLGDLFGFAFNVLEELRAESHALDPGFVELWPEQFDVAVELGEEQAGHRCAYGVSPGDAAHDQPFLYVAPWTALPEGRLLRTTGFQGAELDFSELSRAADQRAAALEFFRAHLLELNPPRD